MGVSNNPHSSFTAYIIIDGAPSFSSNRIRFTAFIGSNMAEPLRVEFDMFLGNNQPNNIPSDGQVVFIRASFISHTSDNSFYATSTATTAITLLPNTNAAAVHPDNETSTY